MDGNGDRLEAILAGRAPSAGLTINLTALGGAPSERIVLNLEVTGAGHVIGQLRDELTGRDQNANWTLSGSERTALLRRLGDAGLLSLESAVPPFPADTVLARLEISVDGQTFRIASLPLDSDAVPAKPAGLNLQPESVLGLLIDLISGPPDVRAAPGKRLSLVAAADDGTLHRLDQLSANGNWSSWQTLKAPPGERLTTPTLTASQDGTLELLAFSTVNPGLWSRRQATRHGAWREWTRFTDPPGVTWTEGQLAVLAGADGRLELFCVNGTERPDPLDQPNHDVWHRWQTQVRACLTMSIGWGFGARSRCW
jgi:hypothetical protein